MKKLLLFVVMTILICSNNVYAEDTTCSNKNKAVLNKDAYKVEGTYSFDNNGFNISIFNITNNLILEIYEENDPSPVIINEDSINDGIYTFFSSDTTNIIKYVVKVRTNKFGCDYIIRTFNIIKPKKNEYSNNYYCKFSKMMDYKYCKEWIEKPFGVSETSILLSINEEYEKQYPIKEKNNEGTVVAEKNNFFTKKNIIIIFIVVLMIIVLTYQVVIIIKSNGKEDRI